MAEFEETIREKMQINNFNILIQLIFFESMATNWWVFGYFEGKSASFLFKVMLINPVSWCEMDCKRRITNIFGYVGNSRNWVGTCVDVVVEK